MKSNNTEKLKNRLLDVKEQIDEAKNKIAKLEGLTEASYEKIEELIGTKDTEKAKEILEKKKEELEEMYEEIKQEYDEIMDEYSEIMSEEED